MKQTKSAGHLAALFTILVWGTTFISTKVLLADFQPVEILFFRFVLGLVALLAADPRPLKGTTAKQELTFAAAGLCGVCLYYLLENVALTYTMASNVGVILSVAPCFTALLSRLFLQQEEKLGVRFFAGFGVAMAGIVAGQPERLGLAAEPCGRSAGAAGRVSVGLLFHFDQKDRRVWLPHHFNDQARQGCKTYEEFTGNMAQTPEADLSYLGVALCGPKKKVNKLTGHMPLLR